MQNIYCDVGDGQYTVVDSSKASFVYENFANPSAFSQPRKAEPICVVDSAKGKTTTNLYCEPWDSKQIPPPYTSQENLYAQPDKNGKKQLTAQSSGHSETQMYENDLYNK